MAKFFIDRPIFAWVIALFILVMGAVSITQLPISQYPPVAPPSIVITAGYPGASAQILEDSVLSSYVLYVSSTWASSPPAIRRR